jgi:hypothetical protein
MRDFLVFPEIAKVRSSLFQINGAKKDPLVLPDAEGTPTTLTEKVYVPVKEHPDVSMHTSPCLAIVTTGLPTALFVCPST